MKLCFNAGPEPIENYFPFAKENGFQWMELTCNNPNNFPHTFDAKRIANIKKLKDKYDLRYGLHSSSFVNSAEIMPVVREASEKHLLHYVELAKQMEVEYLVIHCGYHFSLFPDVVFESLVKTFTPVVELAEKYDIPLGIENMNALHPDAEILYLGVTIDELSRVFGAIKSRYLGLTLDVAHANLLPGGVESFIRAFPDKIVSTHISDNHGDIDRHLPVGEGSIDFRKVFKLLMGIGFQGTLNIELKKNEDRLISKQRLEPILRELGVSSYGGLTVIS